MSSAVVTAPGRTRPMKPRHTARNVTAALVIVAITVVSWIAIGADPSMIIANWQNATGDLVQLFQPDYSFFPKTIGPIFETIEMAVIGTAIGALLSLPLTFLASTTTNPIGWLRGLVRFVLALIRSVPDVLYAAILVAMVGIGALPGIIALVLFSIGIIAKLVSEQLDAEERGAAEAVIAAGGTWPQVARHAMLPQIMPSFIAQTLYTLEVDIRASAVLGLVGAGGIGMLIDDLRTYYQYHYLALVIIEIFIVVLVIEQVSSWLRERLR